MLTEQQCSCIEAGLTEAVEPRKVAAYLCLHMGLMLAEAAALRWEDVDLANGSIALCHCLGKPKTAALSDAIGLLPFEEPRVLPMPPHVRRYLEKHAHLYADGDCFIMSGTTALPALHMVQNILTSVKLKQKMDVSFSASDLRNAFIRRCIQSGMDLYSLCAYIGIKQPNVLVKRFGEYFTPRLTEVNALERFSESFVPQPADDGETPRRMNLLILGAGSQGPVTKEIAEAIGIFQEIAFLDDDRDNRLAIDTCNNYRLYVNRFPIAIPSFGDCHLREQWVMRLETAGFILPTLVDPTATVSNSAQIAEAVVIEPKVIVSAGAEVARGGIISTGSVIEARAKIAPFVHIGAAATVGKGVLVPTYTRVGSGQIIRREDTNGV